jgi:hypothetical protein
MPAFTFPMLEINTKIKIRLANHDASTRNAQELMSSFSEIAIS